MALDGWILDSGQHPPIAPRDRILSALEICTFAIVDAVELPLKIAEPPDGSPVAVTARIIEITPRITLVDIDTDVTAYASTSMIGKALVPAERHPPSVGDQVKAALTLGIDPYLGRHRPSWLPANLIKAWVVTQIRRRDAPHESYRPATTTTPHPASAAYELVISQELERSSTVDPAAFWDATHQAPLTG